MLSFFKVNDPFRIAGILVILLILRVPYLLMDIPLLTPELMWMLTGERMSQGYHMYLDIIDDNGPFSAGVYWLIDLAFGRSLLAYHIIAGLIIIFQIVYINHLFIRYRAFSDTTYLPALVMGVLFHLSFDFLTLSPALLGTMFLVLALGKVFSLTLLSEDSTESVLMVGVFGGIAACFHFPLVFFLPFLIVAGIAVSGFSFNQFILSMVGYFQPILLCSLYYFWQDGLPEFLLEFVFATRIIEAYIHVTYLDMLILFLVPFGFAASGFLFSSLMRSQTINQQKQKQLMMLYMMFALLTLLISNRRTPYQMLPLLPAMAYFINQIFMNVERRVVLKSFFYGFIVAVPLVGYAWTFQKIQSGRITAYGVASDSKYNFTRDRRVVVLGTDMGFYQHAYPSTPFLNYNLSKRVLTDFEDLNDMATTFKYFNNEKPEFIIDEEGVFEELLIQIPALRDLYRKQRDGVYKLIADRN
ncbi:hypothetical protein KIH41_12045 [Litoribacter ruber]|uniref:hypothetical protein n=1 Tax=Litoribacter ruber TaxID=702568 RepID=UPI001BDA7947|nr:hypothetical protein [Litoribacter ruber]MBT0812011.1 hypothetical protein [Litoribacter ruber]